jgi:predicted small lipoprotein YifL
MKKTILTLLLTLAALTAYGQKMPSDYFEEADGYFAQKKYDEALTGYQYIVDNHPRSKYYPKRCSTQAAYDSFRRITNLRQ